MSEPSDIDKISARLPNFWPDTPELYFYCIEAGFRGSGITTELTKFLSLVSSLDQQTMRVISDLVRNPDPVKPYTMVKERLIKEFSISEVRRIQSVLQDLCLGDMKPSAFLRRIREQAGSGFSDSGLKSVWLSQMPTAVQSILSTIDKDLDGLAEVADKIFDVASFEKNQFCEATGKTGLSTGAAPSGFPPLSDIQAQIDELRRDNKSLHSKIDRLLNNKNSPSGSRSRSPFPRSAEVHPSRAPGLCWYHKKFAEKAHKCIEPCSWEEKN